MNVATLFLCALVVLTSCGGQKSQQGKSSKQQVIVDQLGREVLVKKDIERIVSGNMMAHAAAHYVAMQSVETIKGIHPKAQKTAKNSMLGLMAPDLLALPSYFFNNGTLNIEQLLELAPDVYFEHANDDKTIEKLTEIGLPTIALVTHSPTGYDPIAVFSSWIELITNMHGVPARSAQFQEQTQSTLAMVGQELTKVQGALPKVLYLRDHGDRLLRATGGQTFIDTWITLAGGENVAVRQFTGHQDVSMEQIYLWNPDIIILGSAAQVLPVDLITNSIEGQDWSVVNAVQRGKVYKLPIGVASWGKATADAPLMLKWMAQLMHPDFFTYDMAKEIQQYYQEFYDYPLTAEQARAILDPAVAPWQVS